jgi:hypothetical protein
MGRVGFRGRTRRYAFLQVRARSGAVSTPRRRPACVILADSLAIATVVFPICPLMLQKCAFRYFGPLRPLVHAAETPRDDDLFRARPIHSLAGVSRNPAAWVFWLWALHDCEPVAPRGGVLLRPAPLDIAA